MEQWRKKRQREHADVTTSRKMWNERMSSGFNRRGIVPDVRTQRESEKPKFARVIRVPLTYIRTHPRFCPRAQFYTILLLATSQNAHFSSIQ